MPQKSVSVGIVTAPGNVPGLFAQKVLDVVSQHGQDMSSFWRECTLLQQLPENCLLAETELSFGEYRAFIGEILQRFDIPGLGLRIGRRFRATDFGILGYALISARDFRFALHLADKYQCLWGGGGQFVNRHYIEDDQAVYEERSDLPPGRLQRLELEESAAQFLVTRDMLADPGKFRLTRVEFSFPAPSYAPMFEDIFRCPVLFDQPATRILFPAELLDLEFGSANELAASICEEQCRKFLRIIEDRGGLTEKVRTFILNSPGTIPSLQDVADELNMSVRTARRRLKSEGTTYKAIVTEIRMRMARRYLLETPLAIKEIGYLLCYSEVANFQRAFKNWYDITPNEMRQKHAAGH